MPRKIMQILLSNAILSLFKGFCFEYSGQGQQNWAKEHPACAGKRQSPILLSSEKAIPAPIPGVELIGYQDHIPGTLILKNTGHSVALLVKQVASRLPYIFGSVFEKSDEYEFENLHFHWGLKNSRGSEHVLNGVRYPLELHIVHRNNKYPDLETALRHEDGLSVLATFFRLQEEDNPILACLLSEFTKIRLPHAQVQFNNSIILRSFIPNRIDNYYTYKGSLTTPPCSEVVTWIVFSSTAAISLRQMNAFRELLGEKNLSLVDNYRVPQKIGKRRVYVRNVNDSCARG